MSHLVDLRELAARDGRDGSTDFSPRLEHFRTAHARKPALLGAARSRGFVILPRFERSINFCPTSRHTKKASPRGLAFDGNL